MPLRDYRSASAPRARSPAEPTVKARIAGAAGVAALLIVTGIALSLKGRAVAVPTDGDTLCPTDRPLADITVILLDVSDRIFHIRDGKLDKVETREEVAIQVGGLSEL